MYKMLKFDKNNKRLRTQFDNVEWIVGSGLEIDELKELQLSGEITTKKEAINFASFLLLNLLFYL